MADNLIFTHGHDGRLLQIIMLLLLILIKVIITLLGGSCCLRRRLVLSMVMMRFWMRLALMPSASMAAVSWSYMCWSCLFFRWTDFFMRISGSFLYSPSMNSSINDVHFISHLGTRSFSSSPICSTYFLMPFRSNLP